jgi:hypothetical protein
MYDEHPLPPIRAYERDDTLGLSSPTWIARFLNEAHRRHPEDDWTAFHQSGLHRTLKVDARLVTDAPRTTTNAAVAPSYAPATSSQMRQGPPRPAEFDEYLLRFPSAPLYGLATRAHIGLKDPKHDRDVLHSYRLILPVAAKRRTPLRRVYLLHNGLNESESFALYYELAARLIADSGDVACLVRPFPGHLSRSSSPAFGETPLQRYLDDGAHLFRQYLRYMVETRWLLSALSPRNEFPVPAGADLLLESPVAADSLLDDAKLSTALAAEWTDIAHASHRQQPDSKPPPTLDRGIIQSCITALRDTLGFEHTQQGIRGELEHSVHVVGYSLGGFAARSIFMCWPFLIASCSTLLSGGALRELAPTSFSHPEEWQTVLQSLRVELDRAMSSGHFTPQPTRENTSDVAASSAPVTSRPAGRTTFHRAAIVEALAQRTGARLVHRRLPTSLASSADRPDVATSTDTSSLATSEDQRIAGLNPVLFSKFQRIFYGVFQQEYRGSFQSRLAAYRKRLLFIVGGNDPIVRSRAVLDSGPPDGINLVQIGGLEHFLPLKAKSASQRAFKHFWMPEIGRQIINIAIQGEQELETILTHVTLDPNGELPQPIEESRIEPISASARLRIQGDGALDNALFDEVMNDLLARVKASSENIPDRSGIPLIQPGVLFILGNEAFAFLLDPQALLQRAAMLYHDGVSMEQYVRRVEARSRLIFDHLDRICLVLSRTYEERLTEREDWLGVPSQAETVGGRRTRNSADEIKAVNATLKKWSERSPGSIRIFDPSPAQPHPLLPGLLQAAGEQLVIEDDLKVTSLPDCLLWLSHPRVHGNAMAPLIGEFAELLKGLEQDHIQSLIRAEALSLVSMSRARFNPRYRGRIMGAQPRVTHSLLLHAGLCILTSTPWHSTNG